MYFHKYRVAFYDTDAMGVVHHSNYIRIMEVARVGWMRDLGLMKFHIPEGAHVLGVIALNVEFLRPCIFDDELLVCLEGRLNGARLEIRYALWLERIGEFVALGRTDLVPMVAARLVPSRFPLEMRAPLRESPWREQWPPLPSDCRARLSVEAMKLEGLK
jgi:acyl-CoA thioester hydrolase